MMTNQWIRFDDWIQYFRNHAVISFNSFSHSDKIAKVLIKRLLFFSSNIRQDFIVVHSKNIGQELPAPQICDIGQNLCILQPWVRGWYPSPPVEMDRLISKIHIKEQKSPR